MAAAVSCPGWSIKAAQQIILKAAAAVAAAAYIRVHKRRPQSTRLSSNEKVKKSRRLRTVYTLLVYVYVPFTSSPWLSFSVPNLFSTPKNRSTVRPFVSSSWRSGLPSVARWTVPRPPATLVHPSCPCRRPRGYVRHAVKRWPAGVESRDRLYVQCTSVRHRPTVMIIATGGDDVDSRPETECLPHGLIIVYRFSVKGIGRNVSCIVVRLRA